MIRLTRAPTGAAIATLEEAQGRLDELEARGEEAPDSILSAYRRPAVKEAIKSETCEKCAYCESKVTHVSYGDVEHIFPKSRRHDLRLKYDNLTLACSVCNNNKGEYYEPDAPLLNPYSDEPRKHLGGAGPMVVRLGGSQLGQITELKLRLNRPELLDRRKDRLEALEALVDEYYRAPNEALKRAIASELWREADRCKEYSMIVAAYLSTVAQIPRPQAA